ncbi:hypothetical protein EGR_07564 [Echinococcus granulosus]|uniref:DUF5727 domain-containing protein n=1 Tax=Echinococcus granulosus TaxID=6210 RepID=W6U8I3_ECHGR|nr:hypothetical protein EGR_07564 [Echinococcus granulosus]EUB57553.1 hypothetical protein EGR_07564 [Echinococcus granulosus]
MPPATCIFHQMEGLPESDATVFGQSITGITLFKRGSVRTCCTFSKGYMVNPTRNLCDFETEADFSPFQTLTLIHQTHMVCTQCLTTGHEVYGFVGSEFHVQTSLPVDYQILVTDEGTFPISKAGLCSTKLFQCQIAKDGVEERTLTLKGTMNEHLTYIYLLSDEDLIPTTIYFFNNNTWSESTSAHKNNDNGKVIDTEVTSNGSTDYYTCNYGGDWLTHVIHWGKMCQLYLPVR